MNHGDMKNMQKIRRKLFQQIKSKGSYPTA